MKSSKLQDFMDEETDRLVGVLQRPVGKAVKEMTDRVDLLEEHYEKETRKMTTRIDQLMEKVDALAAVLKHGGRSGELVLRTKHVEKIPSKPQRAYSVERWVADPHMRGRVPTFVTEMTGMQLKKDILEEYGANAVFKKGEAPPKRREKRGRPKETLEKYRNPTRGRPEIASPRDKREAVEDDGQESLEKFRRITQLTQDEPGDAKGNNAASNDESER
jgi:hypothetical protein